MRTKYKQWAVDYLKENNPIVVKKIDLENPFYKKPLFVEIGSGKGDFILGFSKKFPSYSFLAVEKVETVAGMMSKKLIDEKVENVAIFPYDTKILFEQIPDNYLSGIYLNFSDPWPKKKHAKRRLTFITFLNEYYRMLKIGGLLVFKSDNDFLYEFTLEEIKQTKFELISFEDEYIFDETNDVMTEYERKFRERNKSIHRIVLKKNA